MSIVGTAEVSPNTATDIDARSYARAVRRVMLFRVVVGVVVRIVRALIPAAIWGDEAMLALNVLGRDYAGLTGNLDHGQIAPLIFLWAERFAILTIGTGEWALRLF